VPTQELAHRSVARERLQDLELKLEGVPHQIATAMSIDRRHQAILFFGQARQRLTSIRHDARGLRTRTSGARATRSTAWCRSCAIDFEDIDRATSRTLQRLFESRTRVEVHRRIRGAGSDRQDLATEMHKTRLLTDITKLDKL
jgi:hypothetical protein